MTRTGKTLGGLAWNNLNLSFTFMVYKCRRAFILTQTLTYSALSLHTDVLFWQFTTNLMSFEEWLMPSCTPTVTYIYQSLYNTLLLVNKSSLKKKKKRGSNSEH